MDSVRIAADMVRNSSNIVAFTGAGVSTESNIPDFRSSKGLYGKPGNGYGYPPEVMLSHTFFIEHTEMFYDYYRNNLVYADAKPNDCHKGLADLEHAGKLKTVITQNIDGLHQAAGSMNVLELHGSVYRNYCTKCGKKFSLQYVMDSKEKAPICNNCGGVVRPDVVLYEEMLDEDTIENAVRCIANADVLMVLGTSLAVYPAAGFLNYYRGNKLILVNKSETPFDNKAHIVIHDSAGKVMREIVSTL